MPSSKPALRIQIYFFVINMFFWHQTHDLCSTFWSSWPQKNTVISIFTDINTWPNMVGTGRAYLLHLELDGGLDLIDLGVEVLVVGEQRGELAGLVQPGSKNTWDLFNQRLRSQESIVLLGWKSEREPWMYEHTLFYTKPPLVFIIKFKDFL